MSLILTSNMYINPIKVMNVFIVVKYGKVKDVVGVIKDGLKEILKELGITDSLKMESSLE